MERAYTQERLCQQPLFEKQLTTTAYMHVQYDRCEAALLDALIPPGTRAIDHHHEVIRFLRAFILKHYWQANKTIYLVSPPAHVNFWHRFGYQRFKEHHDPEETRCLCRLRPRQLQIVNAPSIKAPLLSYLLTNDPTQNTARANFPVARIDIINM